MTYKEFFEKHGLRDEENVKPQDLAGFMNMLDYIYCSKTKEQAMELMSDFYDNADDIFNSIQIDIDKMLEKLTDYFVDHKEELNEALDKLADHLSIDENKKFDA